MHFIGKLTSVYSRLYNSGFVKYYATSSERLSLNSIMEASKNKITFFANAEDATDYFLTSFCANTSQGAGIKNFIKKYPDAVYTTARISGDELMLFQFGSHVNRVSKGLETLAPVSWKKYCAATPNEAQAQLREWFRESSYKAAEKLTRVVQNAIDDPKQNLKNGLDIRLTIVARAADEIGSPPLELNSNVKVTNIENPSMYFHIYAIAEPMPVRDSNENISVVLRKDVINRGENPDVKDANFVRRRQILIDCQGKCEETVMAEAGKVHLNSNLNIHQSLPESWKSTIITEGSSSNFFAIYRKMDAKDHFILRTAGLDKVLGGTVRELLIDKYAENESTAQSISLTVCTEPPTIDEIEEWVGCFLTSTSRLVLPISEVILPVHCSSTTKIEKFTECNKNRSWPELESGKDDNESSSSTAVVYRFDPQSKVMQLIVTETRKLILAHSETLKIR